MVKLLVKLAVVALLANAGYRVGSEYLTFIKFRDGVRDAAMFKASTDTELAGKIMELANEFDVPLEESALSIERRERQVFVSGSYDKAIEVAPTYFYPWHFSWSIQATVSMIVPPYQSRPR